MKIIRAYWRLMMFAVFTIYYASKLIIASYLLGKTPQRGTRIRQQWATRSLDALGVKIEIKNAKPEGAHLFVANHRSYIDGALLPRYILGSIIIKKEVGDWPVLGYGAKASFSIMIDRNDKDSRRHTREQMAELLKHGYSVTVFPEGTTNAAPGIGTVRPGPFQIAMDGGFTVVPVAVEYEDVTDAWVGDDTFVRHFLQSFQKKEVCIKMKFGEPRLITDWEQGRAEVQAWLQQEVLALQAEFNIDSFAKKFHAISIRGRYVYGYLCLLNAIVVAGNEPLHPYLDSTLKEFSISHTLDIWDEKIKWTMPSEFGSGAIRNEVLQHLSTELAESLQQYYARQPHFILEIIETLIDLGTSNLYGGFDSKWTFSSLQHILVIMNLNQISLPDFSTVAHSSVTEHNGWGAEMEIK